MGIEKGAVFWRGSTNGEQYLYPEDLGLKTPHDDAEQDRSSWQSRRRRPRSVFGSKRAMMALMAHPFRYFLPDHCLSDNCCTCLLFVSLASVFEYEHDLNY
jgi:hypothetical protein